MAKRRGNGEGGISKRRDGRWVASVSSPGGRREWIYGKTRREVADRLRVALGNVRAGLPVVSDNQLLGTYLDQWLETTAKAKLRPSTFVSYEGIIRLHLKPALGRLTLRRLSPAHVQALINEKLTTGLSPRRVLYIRAVLRHALNQAVRWGLIARNAAALVDPPRVPNVEVEPFTEAEILRLLSAARGDRLEALYSVAIAMGLRQGEALGLRWSDVDLDAGLVRVRVALQHLKGKFEMVELKTARSRRTLVMPAPIVASLRQHRVRQIQDRLLASNQWTETGLIFTTRTGGPLDGTNVTTAFQRLLKRAGLPKKRFYDLRHSCATLLLVQGVPARVVMEILGHSQISLTMNTYTHVLPTVQLEAASKMGAFLRGSQPSGG